MTLLGLAFVVFGAIMEPMWVIGLKKIDETHKWYWYVFTVIFVYLSPMSIAFAMGEGMSVGVAYSIWTGLGSVFAMIVGYILFKERVDRIKVFLVALIIVGVAGLELSTVI